MNIKRRNFLQTLLAVPAVAQGGLPFSERHLTRSKEVATPKSPRLKISLNAYSFNEGLRNGTMNLEELLTFCASTGFDAVDLTGYYFPGYPNVPSDELVFGIKRKAFSLGLEISGTGVRNDFAQADESKRRSDISHVKSWIEVAARLGAPVIRIFSGLKIPEGYSWEQAASWMIKDIKECVIHGKKHGIIVAVQNHNDFIQTAEHAEMMIRKVNSEWFGLVLDIGSYRTGDPYQQIAQTIPYAVNWQIKENMYVNGREVKTDLNKIMSLIKPSGYNGYLPIETLGAGDPKIKVPLFLAEVKKVLEQS